MNRTPPKIVIERDCVINMDDRTFRSYTEENQSNERRYVESTGASSSYRRSQSPVRVPSVFQGEPPLAHSSVSSSAGLLRKKRSLDSPILDDGTYVSDCTTEDDSIEQLLHDDAEESDSDIDEELAREEQALEQQRERIEAITSLYMSQSTTQGTKRPSTDVDEVFGDVSSDSLSVKKQKAMMEEDNKKEENNSDDIYELYVDDVLEEGSDGGAEEGDTSDISDDSDSASLRSTDESIDGILDSVPAETFAGDATLGRVFSLRRERHLDMEIDSSTEADKIKNKERIAKVAKSSKQQMSVYKNFTVYETVNVTSIVHGQKASSLPKRAKIVEVPSIEAISTENSHKDTSRSVQKQDNMATENNISLSPVETLFTNLSQNSIADENSMADENLMADHNSMTDQKSIADDLRQLDEIVQTIGLQDTRQNEGESATESDIITEELPSDNKVKPPLIQLDSFEEPPTYDSLFHEPSPESIFEKVVEELSDQDDMSSVDWDTHTDGEDTLDLMREADDEEPETEERRVIDWSQQYKDVVKEVTFKLSKSNVQSHTSSVECIGEDRTVSVSSLDQSQEGSEKSYNSSLQTSDSDGSALSRDEEDYEQPFAEIINETKMLTQSIMSAFAQMAERENSIAFSDLVDTTVSESDMDSSVVSSTDWDARDKTSSQRVQSNEEVDDPSSKDYHRSVSVNADYILQDNQSQTPHEYVTVSSPDWDSPMTRSYEQAATLEKMTQSLSQNYEKSYTTQQEYDVMQSTSVTEHSFVTPTGDKKEHSSPNLHEKNVVGSEWVMKASSLPRLSHRSKLVNVEQQQENEHSTAHLSRSLKEPLIPLSPVAAKIQTVRLVSLADHEYSPEITKRHDVNMIGQTADATVMLDDKIRHDDSMGMHRTHGDLVSVDKQCNVTTENRVTVTSCHTDIIKENRSEKHEEYSREWDEIEETLSEINTMQSPARSDVKGKRKANIAPICVQTSEVDDLSHANIILSPTVKEAIYFEDYIGSPVIERRTLHAEDGVEVDDGLKTTEECEDVVVIERVSSEQQAVSINMKPVEFVETSVCSKIEEDIQVDRGPLSPAVDTLFSHLSEEPSYAEATDDPDNEKTMDEKIHPVHYHSVETSLLTSESEIVTTEISSEERWKTEKHVIETSQILQSREDLSPREEDEDTSSSLESLLLKAAQDDIDNIELSDICTDSEDNALDSEKEEVLIDMQEEVEKQDVIKVEKQDMIKDEKQEVIKVAKQEESMFEKQDMINVERPELIKVQKQEESMFERHDVIKVERPEVIKFEKQEESTFEKQDMIKVERQEVIKVQKQEVIKVQKHEENMVEKHGEVQVEKHVDVQVEKHEQVHEKQEVVMVEQKEVLVPVQKRAVFAESPQPLRVQISPLKSPGPMRETPSIHSPISDDRFLIKESFQINETISEVPESPSALEAAMLVHPLELKPRYNVTPGPVQQTDVIAAVPELLIESVAKEDIKSTATVTYEETLLYQVIAEEPTQTINAISSASNLHDTAKIETVPIEPAKSLEKAPQRPSFSELLFIDSNQDEEEDIETEENRDVVDEDSLQSPSSSEGVHIAGYTSEEYLGSVETVIFQPHTEMERERSTIVLSSESINSVKEEKEECDSSGDSQNSDSIMLSTEAIYDVNSELPEKTQLGNVRVVPFVSVKQSETMAVQERQVMQTVIETVITTEDTASEAKTETVTVNVADSQEQSIDEPEPPETPEAVEDVIVVESEVAEHFEDVALETSQMTEDRQTPVKQISFQPLDTKNLERIETSSSISTQIQEQREVKLIETIEVFGATEANESNESVQNPDAMSQSAVERSDSKIFERTDLAVVSSVAKEQTKIQLAETTEQFEITGSEIVEDSIASTSESAVFQPMVQETEARTYDQASYRPMVLSTAREHTDQDPVEAIEYFDLEPVEVSDVVLAENVPEAEETRPALVTAPDISRSPSIEETVISGPFVETVKELEVDQKIVEQDIEVEEVEAKKVQSTTESTTVEERASETKTITKTVTESNQSTVTVEGRCFTFDSFPSVSSFSKTLQSKPMITVEKTIKTEKPESEKHITEKVVTVTDINATSPDSRFKSSIKKGPKVPPKPPKTKKPPKVLPKPITVQKTTTVDLKEANVPLSPLENIFDKLSVTDVKGAKSPCKVNRAHMTEVCEMSMVPEPGSVSITESMIKKSNTEVDEFLMEVQPVDIVPEKFQVISEVSKVSSTLASKDMEREEDSEKDKIASEYDSSIDRIERHVKKMGNVSIQKTSTQKELCKTSLDTCASCTAEGVVKSEEVTTKEMTLVFVWPKGAKIPPNIDTSSVYRELFSRRVTRISDYNAQGKEIEEERQKKRKAICPEDCGPEILL